MLVKFKLSSGDEVHINALQVTAVVISGPDAARPSTLVRTADGCEYDVAEESDYVFREINHYQRP